MNWGDQSKPDKYVSAAAGWDVPLRVRSQSVKMPFRHYLFALFGQSLELDQKYHIGDINQNMTETVLKRNQKYQIIHWSHRGNDPGLDLLTK